MTDGWQPAAVAVCVPVRDEQDLLPGLLHALGTQAGPACAAVSLCFHFDGCTDGSEGLVTAAALPFPVLTTRAAPGGPPNAGHARRLALMLGQRALAAAPTGALLTTDADSVPAADWLQATCRALADADVVAGRIVRDPAVGDPAQDRIERYYDRLHALRRTLDPVPWEPAPAHHHVGGASLAFRAGVYAALGGFQPVEAGEDAGIVDEAQRLGLRVRRDRDVVVQTSARRHGRARRGLADHLRTLDQPGHAVAVAHPAGAAWQYRGHALARARFAQLDQAGVVDRLATALGVTADHIRHVAETSANAEAFAIRVVPSAAGGERLVTLGEAEQALAVLERARHDCAA